MLSNRHAVTIPRPYGYLGAGYGRAFGDDIAVQSPTTSSPTTGTTTPGGDAKGQGLAIASQLLPWVLGQGADTAEEIAAKIANYQRMLATPGFHHIVPGDNYYRNEIAKLQARLQAVQQENSVTAAWRSLGQTGIGVGIAAGVALTAVLAAVAIKTLAKK